MLVATATFVVITVWILYRKWLRVAANKAGIREVATKTHEEGRTNIERRLSGAHRCQDNDKY